MSVITIQTSQGLKRVRIEGEEPTSEELERAREIFEYPQGEQGASGISGDFEPTPGLPESEMGGTQTIPMQMTPVPQPTAPPELRPDTLSLAEREDAKRRGQAIELMRQRYRDGKGVQSRIPDFMKARFPERALRYPTLGEEMFGRVMARNIGGLGSLGASVLGQEELAKDWDERTRSIKYSENPIGGPVEHMAQFFSVFGPASAALKAKGIGHTIRSVGASGSAGLLQAEDTLAEALADKPGLVGDVSTYLATDDDDPVYLQRLKNAIEYAALDSSVLVALQGLKASANAIKPGGASEAFERVRNKIPKRDPNKVVTPPKDGKVQVAHSGSIQLPDKVVESVGRTIGKVFDGANYLRENTPFVSRAIGDKAIRPISSLVEEIDPYFFNKLNRFEVEQNVLRNQYLARINPFIDDYAKMSKADKEKFSRHAFNSEVVEARNVIKKYANQKGMGQIEKNFDEMRSVFDDLHKLANDNGVEVPYTKNYFPRIMEDHDGFLKEIGKDPDKKLDDALQKAFTDAENQKLKKAVDQAVANNTPAPQSATLTDFERREVARKFLEGMNRGDGRQGFQMNRVIDKIPEEHMKFYGGFGSNVQRYVNNLTYRVSRNRFTGDSPLAPRGGYKQEVAERLADGRLRPKEAEELERLFDVRLRGGEQSIGDGLRSFANVTYLSTIANPASSLTQAGEFFLNAYRNGLFPTLQTAGKTIKRTGVSLKDLDLELIAKEMVDPIATNPGRGFVSKFQKGTRKALDKTLGWSLFRKMDFMMKESNLNSALARAQKQLKNVNSPEYKDFVAKQSKFFEGETQGLVDALKRGDINNPNVKVFLYSKLSRTQPISLSEYPEYYIKYKEARPMYFLKSFGLKQLETTRREVLRKIGSGNADEIREGMKQGIRLSLFFGGGTAGVSTLKDYFLDRDDKPGMTGDQMPTRERIASNVMDGMLTLFGLSKYSAYKIKDEPGKGTVELFLPPRMTEFGEGVINLLKGEPSKLYRTIEKSVPLVGKIYSEHFGTAAEYKRKERQKKARQTKKAFDQFLRGPRIPKTDFERALEDFNK